MSISRRRRLLVAVTLAVAVIQVVCVPPDKGRIQAAASRARQRHTECKPERDKHSSEPASPASSASSSARETATGDEVTQAYHAMKDMIEAIPPEHDPLQQHYDTVKIGWDSERRKYQISLTTSKGFDKSVKLLHTAGRFGRSGNWFKQCLFSVFEGIMCNSVVICGQLSLYSKWNVYNITFVDGREAYQALLHQKHISHGPRKCRSIMKQANAAHFSKPPKMDWRAFGVLLPVVGRAAMGYLGATQPRVVFGEKCAEPSGEAGMLWGHLRGGDVFDSSLKTSKQLVVREKGQPPLSFYISAACAFPRSVFYVQDLGNPVAAALNAAFGSASDAGRDGGSRVQVRVNAEMDEVYRGMLCAEHVLMGRSTMASLAAASWNIRKLILPDACRTDPTWQRFALPAATKWMLPVQNYSVFKSWRKTSKQLLEMLTWDGALPTAPVPCARRPHDVIAHHTDPKLWREKRGSRGEGKEGESQSGDARKRSRSTSRDAEDVDAVLRGVLEEGWGGAGGLGVGAFKTREGPPCVAQNASKSASDRGSRRRGKQGKATRTLTRGLLFVKVPKCASSTTAGVALRIAREHERRARAGAGGDGGGGGGEAGCYASARHGWARKMKFASAQRDQRRSFLWTVLRAPASRALSQIFHFRISREGKHPTDKYLLQVLRGFPGATGDGGFQARYVAPSKVPETFWDKEDKEKVQHAAALRSWVGSIRREYDFIGLVERLDESLVALRLILDLEAGDVLYVSSKQSGSYDDLCKRIRPSFQSPAVAALLQSAEWRARNAADYLLYSVANASLDATIHALGPARFAAAMAEHKALLALVHDARCADTAKFPCSADGRRQKAAAKKSCYMNDSGCGFRCLNAVVDQQQRPALARSSRRDGGRWPTTMEETGEEPAEEEEP